MVFERIRREESRITRILTLDSEGSRTVEKWTVRTRAPNKFLARRRAKIFARAKNPTIIGVFFPDDARVTKGRTRQTTFGEVFPSVSESLSVDEYDVDLIVVRRRG